MENKYASVGENDLPFANFLRPAVPHIIQERARVGNLFLIRFEPSLNVSCNANIYAFDSNGRLVWKIEPVFPDSERSDPYVYMGWNDDQNRLVVQTFFGNYGLVDLTSGRVEFVANYGR